MTEKKLNLARACAKGEHLFTPLGHHRGRFYFRSADAVMWWSPGDLCRVGPALVLVPDIQHWRAMYPRGGKAEAVDWEAAGAGLLRMAKDAGPYTPAPGEGPAPVGRPRLSDEERQRRKAEHDASKLESRTQTSKPQVVASPRGRRRESRYG